MSKAVDRVLDLLQAKRLAERERRKLDLIDAHRLMIAETLDKVKLCACGSDEPWDIVKLVLERRAANEVSSYEPTEDASGRWFEFATKALDGWGLLEHGGSISWAWLTGEGEIVLEFLREFGTVSHEWPDWATELTPLDERGSAEPKTSN